MTELHEALYAALVLALKEELRHATVIHESINYHDLVNDLESLISLLKRGTIIG